MKITTWNINGVHARLPQALAYLKQEQPDVVCLQELKSLDADFPRAAFEKLGYHVEVFGQKAFNGVALLAHSRLEDVHRGLPGDDSDTQARWIDARVRGRDGMIRIGCVYLPNGNPAGSDKFAYKLAWMARLDVLARALIEDETPLVLAGDFNVIAEAIDAKYPENWTKDSLYQPEVRQAFRSLLNIGLTDAFRALHTEPGHYSYWDYRTGTYSNGIRIDHILLSRSAETMLRSAGIDTAMRGGDTPSDHAPVWVELDA
jgi:exodeoxyribonuclease III